MGERFLSRALLIYYVIGKEKFKNENKKLGEFLMGDEKFPGFLCTV